MSSESAPFLKTPVFCPRCHEQPLRLRLLAHQHLSCDHCQAEFCAVCVLVALAPSVADYEHIRRVAALN